MNKHEMHPIRLSTELSLFTVSSVTLACLVTLCGGAGVGPLPERRFSAELTYTSPALYGAAAGSAIPDESVLPSVTTRAPVRKAERKKRSAVTLLDPSVSGRLTLSGMSVLFLLKYHRSFVFKIKIGSRNFLFS